MESGKQEHGLSLATLVGWVILVAALVIGGFVSWQQGIGIALLGVEGRKVVKTMFHEPLPTSVFQGKPRARSASIKKSKSDGLGSEVDMERIYDEACVAIYGQILKCLKCNRGNDNTACQSLGSPDSRVPGPPRRKRVY